MIERNNSTALEMVLQCQLLLRHGSSVHLLKHLAQVQAELSPLLAPVAICLSFTALRTENAIHAEWHASPKQNKSVNK